MTPDTRHYAESYDEWLANAEDDQRHDEWAEWVDQGREAQYEAEREAYEADR